MAVVWSACGGQQSDDGGERIRGGARAAGADCDEQASGRGSSGVWLRSRPAVKRGGGVWRSGVGGWAARQSAETTAESGPGVGSERAEAANGARVCDRAAGRLRRKVRRRVAGGYKRRRERAAAPHDRPTEPNWLGRVCGRDAGSNRFD